MKLDEGLIEEMGEIIITDSQSQEMLTSFLNENLNREGFSFLINSSNWTGDYNGVVMELVTIKAVKLPNGKIINVKYK